MQYTKFSEILYSTVLGAKQLHLGGKRLIYARNTKTIIIQFHDHQENLCIDVLSFIPLLLLCNKLSEIFKDFCRKFQDVSRISLSFSLFKDMMLFQGLFKTHENHEKRYSA